MAQGFPIHLRSRLFKTTSATLAAGWKIQTYVSGTSTPLTTYSNGGLTSANTNPIIVDPNGFYRCYVAAGVLVKADVYDENDVFQYTDDELEPMLPQVDPPDPAPAVPVGTGLDFYGSSLPTNYLWCDGSLVSRTTYAALFAVIGTTYGAGDGSTTFAVPDVRQRFTLGKAASGTGNTLGATGGAIDHVHTGPSHTHTGPSHTHTGPSHTHTGPSHTHTVASHTHTIAHTHTVSRLGWGGTQIAGAGTLGHMLANDGLVLNLTEATQDTTTSAASNANSGGTTLTTDASGTGTTSADGTGNTGASGTGDTGASGTGNTGTSNPPYIVCNKIIRYAS